MQRRKGYCIHGKYVGGIGRDILCGACEMGQVYRIIGLPLWEIRSDDGGLLQTRRKYENLSWLHLVEKFPDTFFLGYREDDEVWATLEEAIEALDEGYTVISPYVEGEIVPNPYENAEDAINFREDLELTGEILNIVKFHDSALYVKLQDYVRERE